MLQVIYSTSNLNFVVRKNIAEDKCYICKVGCVRHAPGVNAACAASRVGPERERWKILELSLSLVWGSAFSLILVLAQWNRSELSTNLFWTNHMFALHFMQTSTRTNMCFRKLKELINACIDNEKLRQNILESWRNFLFIPD